MKKLASALALAVLLAVALVAPSGAWAGTGEMTFFASAPNSTQAGGHPDISVEVEYGEGEGLAGVNDPRTITTHLPAGLIGNPHAIPTCSVSSFSQSECSPSAQVGYVSVYGGLFGEDVAPLYNLEPKPGQAGLLAFFIQESGSQQYIEIAARTESDYGLDTQSNTIFHPFGLHVVRLYLWGVPALPVHDPLRFKSPVVGDCNPQPSPCQYGGAEAGVAPAPFISNPTTCGVPLETSLVTEFYNGRFQTGTVPWPATTGCSQLAFNPSLTVKPTTTEGDAPSGLDVDLQVPQLSNPFTPSPSEIRGAKVTLPAGVSINPNAADGKTDCAGAATGIGTRGPAACPEDSKVGTLSIDSSALPGPIPGAIYLGEPQPGNPYRLILAADGYGTHVKLAGSAHADPSTGQIVVSFEELPQAPLTDFNMHFFGSERGLLATPTQCGSYPVEAEFDPWDDALATQSSTSFFSITTGGNGSACPNGPRPLAPQFSAGSANPTAGRHTTFRLEIGRKDGEQNLSGLTVSPPAGISGTLKGIPYCPESTIAGIGGVSGRTELATPSCPSASQVGTAVVGAGAGDHPLYVPGRVFLAGPYKGAPLSLVTVVPAVSGPYDLGNVVVRAALEVNPATARVTAVSDPLPQILGGIPLRVRTIRIELDRPEFTLNPTNCEPLATEGTIAGSEGAAAKVSSHFQAGNCADLGFGPKLALRLSGGVNRRGHPAIKATVTTGAEEANIKRAAVALPKGELLDNSHIGNTCTRPQFAADKCPANSLLGTAEAVTPLLAAPLKGNVYLRSNPNHKLPDIVADLEGQIDIELAGKIDTTHGHALRTTFEGVPDAPVTQFTLNLLGGKKGLLQNETTLCGKAKRAQVKMTGQNGVTVSSAPKLQVACRKSKPKAKAKKSTSHSGGVN
jgi:hypothetical protein